MRKAKLRKKGVRKEDVINERMRERGVTKRRSEEGRSEKAKSKQEKIEEREREITRCARKNGLIRVRGIGKEIVLSATYRARKRTTATRAHMPSIKSRPVLFPSAACGAAAN